MQALGPAVHARLRFRPARCHLLSPRPARGDPYLVDGQPLPSDWAIPIVPGEVVVACAPLRPPLSGVAALVVWGAILPQPKVDLPERERIARALADMLLAELKQSTT